MGRCTAAAPRLDRHLSFGECRRRVDLGGTVIRDTCLPGSAAIPEHEHLGAYLCIVLEGGYEERSRRDIDCAPGSIVPHPGGHRHANRVGPAGARCLNVEFDEALLADAPLAPLARSDAPLQVAASHPSLGRLRTALAWFDEAAALAIFGAMLDVVCEGLRSPAGDGNERWVGRVVERIEADLARAPTIDELARLAGVHPNHLMRCFKRRHGETVGGYLRRRRLEVADAQLLLGGRPIASIAAEAGFFDQAHFTRAFRRHFGVTPGLRRRMIRS
jgi:AraC family transcriptional regulator